jgi:chemotaxis protein histidine kinase CheA
MIPSSVGTRETCELYLHESLELCQYLEEGLLLLTNGLQLEQLPRLLRLVEIIKVGAEQLEFKDIYRLAKIHQDILRALETFGAGHVLEKITLTVLQLLSEQLRFTLLLAGYQVVIEGAVAPEQAELIQQFLFPKSLTVLQDALLLHNQRLCHQIWDTQLQLWCSWSLTLNDADGVAIATAALQAIETVPEAIRTTGHLAVTALQMVLKHTARQDVAQRHFVHTEGAIPVSVEAEPQPAQYFYTSDHFLWMTEGRIFYIPSESIAEIVVPQGDAIHRRGTQCYLHWKNQDIVLYDSKSLILPRNIHLPMGYNGPILVLEQDEQYLALALEIEHLVMEPGLRLESPPPGTSPDPAIVGWTKIQDELTPLIDVSLWLQSDSGEGQSHPPER